MASGQRVEYRRVERCRSVGGRARLPSRLLAILLLALLLIEPPLLLAAEPPLVMGIFPRRNAQLSNKLFSPLADYLSTRLDREVQLVLSKDFSAFWRGVESRHFDIVHFNQYHYVRAHKEQGYQVIVRNVEFDESTIAGAIMVRRDSGIDSVSDLKGRRVIFGGGPKAMQSYIVARYLLQQGGLAEGDYEGLFARNPPNAILTTYVGEADAAGAGDKVLRLGVVRNNIDTRQIRALAVGPQLPHLPWAVRDDMSPELRQRIQRLLVTLKGNEVGQRVLQRARLDGLVSTVDGDYDAHRRIILEVLGEAY